VRLTVASFNIRSGIAFDGSNSWPFRRRATAQAIARLGVDLVGLQEAYAFQERYLTRTLDGLAATGTGRGARGGSERCSVLYRRSRLRLEGSCTRWLSDTPDVPGSRTWGNPLPRIATLCRFVERPSGFPFAVANVHLDGASTASRERAAEALLSWLEPGLPWLLTGDLNETPCGTAVRRFVASGLRDVLGECVGDRSLRREGGEATENGFGRMAAGRRIDYVLVSAHWTIEQAWVARDRPGGRLASDHWPVAARLSLDTPPAGLRNGRPREETSPL
jgi:endonuclease/exonuclease/phosphatase family metal-dependent hydrolase